MAAIDTATRLSLDRTYLAHERTLMAWVRTGTSLITFGFSIYKFFAFEAGKGLPGAGLFVLSPRVFGMIMIATGLIALVLSTFEHRANVEKLRAEFGVAPRSVSLFVAAVVSILGALAFVAALLQA